MAACLGFIIRSAAQPIAHRRAAGPRPWIPGHRPRGSPTAHPRLRALRVDPPRSRPTSSALNATGQRRGRPDSARHHRESAHVTV